MIAGTHITVKTILEFPNVGDSMNDILEAYPTLMKADVEAASQSIARGWLTQELGAGNAS
jgi:uncharacterized protein (DUF433 family)